MKKYGIMERKDGTLNRKEKQGKLFLEYFLIALGVFVMSLGLNLFLIPRKISTGGVSGLSMILHHLTGVGTGFYVLLFNIPLFCYGYGRLGKAFVIRSGFATVLLSVFLELTASLAPVTEDGLLSALYGGLLAGGGMGLVFRCHASTGGTDLIAMGLRRKSRFSMGTLVMSLDACIVLLSVVVFWDISLGLYALVALAVGGKVVDYLEEGPKLARGVFIISDKQRDIARQLLYEMERGVTALHGAGLFSGTQKQVLFCVIPKREIVQLKHILQQTDPNAFVVITDAKEVLGEGFQE